MMNKYTHHLSVAFVVSLEKFPIISHKKSLPEIRFSYRTWGGVFYGVLQRAEYSHFFSVKTALSHPYMPHANYYTM